MSAVDTVNAVDAVAFRDWAADARWVRELVQRRSYHRGCRSPDWLGIPIAERFGLNLNDRRERFLAQEIIVSWLAHGVLAQKQRRDFTGKRHWYLITGKAYQQYTLRR